MHSADVAESVVTELHSWAVCYSTLWRKTLREANFDPEDVAQFAWAQFFRAGPAELPDSGEERRRLVKAWLRRVIGNKAMELRRQITRRKATGSQPLEITLVTDWSDVSSATRSAYTKAVSRENVVDIERAIESLDALQQEVVLLRAFENRSHAEVADELGISIVNSRQTYSRARAKLKDRLRPELVAMLPVGDGDLAGEAHD